MKIWALAVLKFFDVVLKFELPNARVLNFPKISRSSLIGLVLIIGDCVYWDNLHYLPFIVCHFLQVLIFRDNVSITKNTCKFLLQQNNFCINLLNNLLYFLQYFFFILAYDRSRNGCEAKPRKDETGLPATFHLPIRQIPRGCLILLYTMVRFHEIFVR